MKKKTKAKKRAKGDSSRKGKRAAKKMGGRASAKSVVEYLAQVPEPARSTLETMREAIRAVVPEGSTEVISYGIPAFKHKKVLVWYAAFAKHCSLFPTSTVIEQFKDELKGYTISKGTIQFPVDRPMPGELVRKMVMANVARNR